MSIRTKILLAFAACLLVLVVQAVVTALFVRDQQQAVERIVQSESARKRAFTGIEQLQNVAAGTGRIEAGDTSADTLATLGVYLSSVREQVEALETVNSGSGLDAKTAGNFAQAAKEFRTRAASVAGLAGSKDQDQILEVTLFLGESVAALREQFSVLGVVYGKQLDAAVAVHERIKNRPAQSAVATVLVGVVLIAVFAIFASRWLGARIGNLVQRMDDIAEGRLSRQGHIYEGKDEFSMLNRHLDDVSARLAGIIDRVGVASSNIGVAAGEISQGNHDLSKRTESQAALLAQTSSRMETLTQTARQTADNAREVARMVDQARSRAENGGALVARAIGAMDRINAASARISEIIGTIDGIAFQTNLLALNAAVEAARAGEQGRGFAVVAEEVRGLAQRSAEASHEVKQLVSDAVERARDGSAVVRESGDLLSSIVSDVQKVAGTVGEIAHANTDQSEGLGKINEVVVQLEAVTQQNAAVVHQVASASRSFLDQTRFLDEQMAFFQVGERHATSGDADGRGEAAAARWQTTTDVRRAA